MTDYKNLVKFLRGLSPWAFPEASNKRMKEAADAIEALQAEVQFYDALAEEWKSLAESKEQLLGLYRAEQAKHFYSAIDNNGRNYKGHIYYGRVQMLTKGHKDPTAYKAIHKVGVMREAEIERQDELR